MCSWRFPGFWKSWAAGHGHILCTAQQGHQASWCPGTPEVEMGSKWQHSKRNLYGNVLEEGPPLGVCFEPSGVQERSFLIILGYRGAFWEQVAPIVSKIFQAGPYRKHMWPNVGICSPPSGHKTHFCTFPGVPFGGQN